MWNMTADSKHNGKQAVLFLFNVLVNGGMEGCTVTEKKR